MNERHDHDPARDAGGVPPGGEAAGDPWTGGDPGAREPFDDPRLEAAADRLRGAAHARASTVQPRGTWDHVRHRLAFERRRRRHLRVAATSVVAAAAVVLGLVAAVPMLRDDPTQRVDTAPADDPGEQPDPGTTEPEAPAGGDVFPGIWPFTSQAQVEQYVASGSTEWSDPETTARRFLREYVGMLDPIVAEPLGVADSQPPQASIGFRPAGTPDTFATTTVFLTTTGDDDVELPWLVTGAQTGDVVVTDPSQGGLIENPVAVAGEATGFEGTVVVTVRDDAGTALGQEPFIAGTLGEMGPFSGEVAFDTPSSPAGAMLFTTDTGRDDVGVPAATVYRVAFGDWQPGGLPDGRPLYLLVPHGIERWVPDADRGAISRSPVVGEHDLGQGAQDLTLAPDGSALYYSRGVTACLWEIVAVPLDRDGSRAGDPEVVTAGTAPAVSPDGRWLAHAVDEDCDGHDELVLRDLATGQELRRWADARDRYETWSRVTSLSFVDASGDAPVLAYSLLAEHVAEVRILDDADTASVLDSREISPDRSGHADRSASVLDSREIGPGRSGHADSDVVEWVAPRYDRDAGRLFVVEECCELNVRDQFRVLAVDVDRPDDPAVLHETGDRVTRVLPGRAGSAELLVMGDGRLLRLDAHGVTELARAEFGVTDATW